MIVEFRSELRAHLEASTSLPVQPDIPDDVAEVPCLVVGRASVGEGEASAILDLQATVWVIGRRQSAGGRDDELDAAVDQVLAAFGDARAVQLASGVFHAVDVQGRVVDVGGQSYPAYTVSVETSITSC